MSKSREKGGIVIEMSMNSPEPAAGSPRIASVEPEDIEQGSSGIHCNELVKISVCFSILIAIIKEVEV
jgi:hypothetical protein